MKHMQYHRIRSLPLVKTLVKIIGFLAHLDHIFDCIPRDPGH
jgi:hypothetical protein